MQNEINLTEVNASIEKGYGYLGDRQYPRALRTFYSAWLDIPKPQTDYPIAASVLASIGDCYFRMRKYKLAIEALRSALSCPKTNQHGFILLRLGQSMNNTGQEQQAQTYLRRAYSIGGEALFAEEHPKYLLSIKSSLV